MTNELTVSKAAEEWGRRLPPGWRVKSWKGEIYRDHITVHVIGGNPYGDRLPGAEHRSLDVLLYHDPTQTEFSLRCTEMPDWNWLTAALLLAEKVQTGIEVSIAHGQWWW